MSKNLHRNTLKLLGVILVSGLITACEKPAEQPDTQDFDPKPILKHWHAQKKKGRYINAMFNDF